MGEKYDVVVVGGGPGGYTAAIEAAKSGLHTALVECEDLGGTCLNRGCIPTKAMLHVSELLRQISKCEQFGVKAGDIQLDFDKMVDYREETVSQLVRGVEALLDANGVAIYRGKGTLRRGKRIAVREGQDRIELEADNIILASGSEPRLLSVPGIELDGVLTSDTLLKLNRLPESLIIIGGGVIGVEFAEIFTALGSKVAIVEAQTRLLPGMDRDISQNLRPILKRRGVELHLGVNLTEIRRSADGLECRYLEKGRECNLAGQYILCAVGRRPKIDGLLDEGVNIALDRGFVAVDNSFRTNIEGVYAIGDLIGGAQLAHAASAQGYITAELIAGKKPSKNVSLIPKCIYTDPEIASVGIMEEEAREAGIEVRVGRFPMAANGRTLIERGERGFIKVVARGEDDMLMGAQLMCPRATDMIGELATAIANDMTAAQLLRAMKAHPTFSEGIAEALEDLHGEAIHVMPVKRSL